MKRQRKCKRCGSTNLTYKFVKVGEKTYSGKRRKKHGLLWYVTIGPFAWLLSLGRIRRRKPLPTSVRVAEHRSLAFCKDCGYRWYVK